MTTTLNDPMVGCVLDGRYEIRKRLARGGMATVYTALDTRLTRIVAVKVMHEGLGDDQDFTRKFDREARAAARLSHPNVVSVFDQGHDHGRPYIVMELVDGCTLRRIISRDAPLPPQRCLELIDQVLSALAAAHENNLVHRDIKPENVLLSDRGQLKVADFGLARAITAQTATATQGMLIGTVSYLPPELVQHGTATARSDVYSTGVVLFELLTGTKPHTGETPIQVAYAHVHSEIPSPSTRLATSWRTSRDGIPPYLDALVRAATQRDPQRRPADARELQQMVRRALRALDEGVMNDQALTAEFSRGFADLEHTAPLDWGTPISPTLVEPDLHSSLHASQRIPVGPSMRSRVGAAEAGSQGGTNGPAAPSSAGARTSTMTPPEGVLGAEDRFSDDEREPAAAIPVAEPRSRRPVRRGATPVPARLRRRRTLVALVMLVVLALGTAAGSWWMVSGRYVHAPAVAGMTQVAAQQAVAEQGLEMTTEQAFSENVPAGQVMSSDPVAGADVVRGGRVHVVVSRGPERFEMPKVVGSSRHDAVAAISQANLGVGDIVEEWDEKAPVDTVTKATKEPGSQLRRGERVDLTVSKGPRPITINNYAGRTAKDAQDSLENAGFAVEVRTENSSSVPEGKVISQTPNRGTGKRGDKVVLVRSLGPVMVDVPQVKAMGVKEATDALTNAGFKVVTKPSATYLGLGFVASSDPGQGKAPQGSTITLLLV